MQRIGTKITVTVPDKVLKEIDKVAERHQVSKAEASRMLLEIGLDAYRVYLPTGIINLAEFLKRLKKKFKAEKKAQQTEIE